MRKIKCFECEEPFTKKRVNQMTCSEDCQQRFAYRRIRVASYRRDHPHA